MLSREITCQIVDITEKKDKNGNYYLILEVDNDGDVFVFPSKIDQETWKELRKGITYQLVLEEGKGGLNLLVGFEIKKRKDE